MLTKNTNTVIIIASEVANYLIVVWLAVLCAHLLWWIMSPSLNSVYNVKNNVKQFSKDAQHINDRNPFGVVSLDIVKVKVVAPIISQLELLGVYYNPPRDSVAFIQYQKQSLNLQVGQTIESTTAIINSIDQYSITVKDNDSIGTVNMESLADMSNNDTTILNDTTVPNGNDQSMHANTSRFFNNNRKRFIDYFENKNPNNAGFPDNKNPNNAGVPNFNNPDTGQ